MLQEFIMSEKCSECGNDPCSCPSTEDRQIDKLLSDGWEVDDDND